MHKTNFVAPLRKVMTCVTHQKICGDLHCGDFLCQYPIEI